MSSNHGISAAQNGGAPSGGGSNTAAENNYLLRRKAYQQLLEWKNNGAPNSALLIKGARRTGKTTLVEEFGRREYHSYLIIDFYRAPDEVKNYFEQYKNDLDTLYLYLSTFYNVQLFRRESLVIFDEIQAFPPARGLIKYLVADGRYDFIETGSLISIKQNVESIMIPSEEESMSLEPFDFEEFLWAMGENQLADMIRHHFSIQKPLPDQFHRQAMNLFRQYMLVGGMPQPLSIYVEERQFQPVDRAKRRILELYRNDVGRFAGSYQFKVVSILDGIPGQLAKHQKRFTLSSLQKGARMRTYEEAFFWLSDAHISNMCFASTDPTVGLGLSRDERSLKCYMADTGLLVSLGFADSVETNESVYRAVLRGDIGINEGMLTENVVAQMLVAGGHQLFFYSQTGKKPEEQQIEIDFLIARPFGDAANKPRICPIEVKSGRQYATTSLDRFNDRFGKRVGTQYVVHPKPLEVTGPNRVYLPLYMGFCL